MKFKKAVFLTIALVFIFGGVAFAESAGFSGPITTDTAIMRPVQLSGFIIKTDGSTSGTVTFYDGTSTSDPEILSFTVDAGTTSGGATLPLPIDSPNGLYVDVSSCTVYLFGARGIGH